MSERMFIKEEKEEWGDALTSTSTYSPVSPSLSVSVPPTQRVLPSTPSLRTVTGLGLFGAPSAKPELVVDKTKRFLATTAKFAASVSPATAATVRKLIFRQAFVYIFFFKYFLSQIFLFA